MTNEQYQYFASFFSNLATTTFGSGILGIFVIIAFQPPHSVYALQGMIIVLGVFFLLFFFAGSWSAKCIKPNSEPAVHNKQQRLPD